MEPRGRVTGRLHFVTPYEPRRRLPGKRRSTPGPEADPVQRPQPLGADGHAVDSLREAGIARLAARPGARRNRQAACRVAEGDLAHHPSDAAPERREVEGEEERGAQRTGAR